MKDKLTIISDNLNHNNITELEARKQLLILLGVGSSADFENEIDITRCPKCGSSDHLMIIGHPYKCMDCGNKWT